MHGRGVAFQMLPFGAPETLSLHPKPEFGKAFRTQLRAVLRASASAETPVTALLTGARTVADFRWARRQLGRCRRELEAEGRAFHEVRVGAVVDSPAAVFRASALAVGSETLLIDAAALARATIYSRAEGGLPNYHALGWMLRRVLLAGHRVGCSVILSGELEQFPQALRPLAEMGFDGFAVPVRSLLPLHGLLSEASGA